ncbi:MAG: glycosyltransferase [Acidobacteriota bacterium]
MAGKEILFISGSIGLGHVLRDLAIAVELRRQIPGVRISWLAASPASDRLEEAGERLLPEAAKLVEDSAAAEDAAKNGFRLNLLKYLSSAMPAWKQNVRAFSQVLGRCGFDLIVADEAYEIAMALRKGQVSTDAHFIMIYDFFGNVSMSSNPLEMCMTYLWNRQWAKVRRDDTGKRFTQLFIGEPEDVPDRRLGFLLPNAREAARQACEFVGYILPFEPQRYSNPSQVKAELGYGPEPLVICAVGGTAVGGELLELCGRAYGIMKGQTPDLRMLCVCGPRLAGEALRLPEGLEVRGYVPELYKHLAASDLAIVQAGGTTTLELTALRRPFIYFPLEGHFEQQVHVSGRLERHGAGVRMNFRETTPEGLAKRAASLLGKEVEPSSIPIDGARRAAEIAASALPA